MPCRWSAGGGCGGEPALALKANPEAEVRDVLAGGTLFNVLDVTGGWAWGQVGDDGFVGYLPVDALEP
jgi:hypothetical protein